MNHDSFSWWFRTINSTVFINQTNQNYFHHSECLVPNYIFPRRFARKNAGTSAREKKRQQELENKKKRLKK